MSDCQDCPDQGDQPDLLQLLQSLGFAHWHKLLASLGARYDGWLVDYEVMPEAEPDFRPMVEILQMLRDFPPAGAGDDLAMVRVVSELEFLTRAARNKNGGLIAWNPFAEKYRTFKKRYPECFAYWEFETRIKGQALTDWLLGQLIPRGDQADNLSQVGRS